MSGTTVNLLDPVLFYQNPANINQPQNDTASITGNMTNCRGCNTNLTSNNPASQYQRQRLIQNTVRVRSSLYTMNLAGLSGYQKPLSTWQPIDQNGTIYYAPPNVYWNQMSDRAQPSNQTVKTASGTSYHGSSVRHTITRLRPGALSPGGVGCDIKHNSYDRYLNRLKGKGPLRRGIIPSNYGDPIIFNKAYPIYGGKTFKSSIINGCDCPDVNNKEADLRIYGSALNSLQDQILSVTYTFNVGDYVWAKKLYLSSNALYKAEIIDITNGMFTIKFVDDGTTEITTSSELLIYFDCNCSNLPVNKPILEDATSLAQFNAESEAFCANIHNYTSFV